MPTVKEIINELNKKYKPTDVVAVGVFTKKDIKDRLDHYGITLNNAEIQEILDILHDEFDPTVGICEEVIDDVIHGYLPENVDDEEDYLGEIEEDED